MRSRGARLAMRIYFMPYLRTFCNFLLFGFWLMDCNKAFEEYLCFSRYKFQIFPHLGTI